MTPAATRPPSLDRFLRALDAVGSEGSDTSRTCPAHQDVRESLSINHRDGHTLIHCHAGCAAESVLTAVGLTFADLYDNHPEVVATYDYTDRDGNFLFQVCRREPKDFRQRHRDGEGHWAWGRGPGPLVLYHLPEVLRAAAAGDAVWVVEGEKDVESVRSLNLVATTAAMGAGKKWLDQYTDALAGAKVKIVADRDGPGIKHALKVAELITARTGQRVPVLMPARGKDVSDHIDAGYSMADLQPYTPELRLPLDAERQQHQPPEEQPQPQTSQEPANHRASWIEPGDQWILKKDGDGAGALIPGILAARGLGLLGGEPKVGKTWLVIELMLAVANNVSFFERYPVSGYGRVLYLASEGSREKVQDRLRSLALGKRLDVGRAMEHLDLVWRKPIRLDDPEDLAWLRGKASAYVLVVVDILRDMWSGEENSNDEVSRLLRGLREVAGEGPTVLLVQHFGKSSQETSSRRPGQRIRGASAFHAALDSGIYLERGRGSQATQVTLESKDDVPAPTFSFAWPSLVDGKSGAQLEWRDGDEADVEKVADLGRKLAKFISTSPGITRRDLQSRIGRQREAVGNALDWAEDQRLIHRQQEEVRSSSGRRVRRDAFHPGPGPEQAGPLIDEKVAAEPEAIGGGGSGNPQELPGSGTASGVKKAIPVPISLEGEPVPLDQEAATSLGTAGASYPEF